MRVEGNVGTGRSHPSNGAPVENGSSPFKSLTMLTIVDRCSTCQWPKLCESDRTCWDEERKVWREVAAYRKEERRRELGLGDGLAAGVKVTLPEEPHEAGKRLLGTLGAEWDVLDGEPAPSHLQAVEPEPELVEEEGSVSVAGSASSSSTSPRTRKAPRRKAPKWSKRTLLNAIRAHALEHGHPPAARDLGMGAYSAARRLFPGGWPDAVETAGFDRPARGKNYNRAGVAQLDRAPADQAGDAGSKPAPRLKDSSGEGAVSQPDPRGHARPGDGGGPDGQEPGMRAPIPAPPSAEAKATPPPTPIALSVRAALLGVLDSLRVLVDAVMPEPPE